MSRRRKIAFVSLLVIIVCAGLFIHSYFKIEEIEVEGNTRETADVIKDYIFEKDYETNTLIFYIKQKFADKKSIPFVATYEVEIVNNNKVRIVVYEKDVIGYMQYMGSYIYFDKDGIVVESSSELIEEVPLVTGLTFDNFVLNEKLPVSDENVFKLILDLTQNVRKYDIKVDKINITEDLEGVLYIGDVKVLIGGSEDLNQKLSDLSDIYNNLEGRSGTLDMKEVDPDGQYTMEVDK